MRYSTFLYIYFLFFPSSMKCLCYCFYWTIDNLEKFSSALYVVCILTHYGLGKYLLPVCGSLLTALVVLIDK